MGETTVFHCPQCGQAYSITLEQVGQYAGRMLACTRCGQRFVVPENIGQGAAAPQGYTPQGYPAPGGVAPQQYGPPMVQTAEGDAQGASSGMSIASLVCGLILCVPFISGILAGIFGILALRDVRSRNAGGKGMAVAGLILGGVNIVVWIVLSAMMIPAVGAAKERTLRMQCGMNLRQIGTALAMYASDNNGRYPAGFHQLANYGVSPNMFVCPSTGTMPAPTMAALQQPGRSSYIYIQPPPGMPPGADFVVVYENPADHQNQGLNVLFYDGSVQWFNGTTAQRIYSDLRAGRNPPRQ